MFLFSGLISNLKPNKDLCIFCQKICQIEGWLRELNLHFVIQNKDF